MAKARFEKQNIHEEIESKKLRRNFRCKRKKQTNIGKPITNNRGITLIALIITIIVMLILVAVTINTAVKSGLFGHAKDATGQWADAQYKESNLSIDDYVEEYVGEGLTNIYAALYNDGTDIILTFNNKPNFDEENLIKIYTDDTGKPLNIKNKEFYYYEEIGKNARYNICLNTESNKSANEIKYTNTLNVTKKLDNKLSDIKIQPVAVNIISHSDVPWYEDKEITKVEFKARIAPENTKYWFLDLHNLKEFVNIKNLDTRNVTNMHNMFGNCWNITNIDVSQFNTNKVTDMSDMFTGCRSLISIDVTKFNTSRVTDMSGMFSWCNSLSSIDVTKFNTSNVTNMEGMFEGCESLKNIDVTKFDTGNVTNMNNLFGGCGNLTSIDVGNFKTSKVTDISGMFYSCWQIIEIDLSKFDTTNVTEMSSLFANCNSLKNVNLTSFNTSNVTTIERMFFACESLEIIDLTSFTLRADCNIDDAFFRVHATAYVKDKETQDYLKSRGFSKAILKDEVL